MPQGVRTKFDEDVLRAEWAKGTPMREIAAMFGVRSDATVSVHAKRLGLPPRGRGAQGPNTSKDERVRALHADGLTMKAVAATLKMSPMTVRRALDRLGLEPHRPTPKPKVEKEAKPTPEVTRKPQRRHASTEEIEAVLGREVGTYGCARCGSEYTGSLLAGRSWFREHACAAAAAAAA